MYPKAPKNDEALNGWLCLLLLFGEGRSRFDTDTHTQTHTDTKPPPPPPRGREALSKLQESGRLAGLLLYEVCQNKGMPEPLRYCQDN